jgi:alpha-tubulin suppressor-like RCC1 family protein
MPRSNLGPPVRAKGLRRVATVIVVAATLLVPMPTGGSGAVLDPGASQDDDALAPVAVAGSGSGSTAPGLSSGAYHTCAVRTDTTVHCWGANEWGQLGDGTPGPTEHRYNPVQVIAPTTEPEADVLSGAVQVASGAFHTCALMADGTVRCWGANWYGQLGDGTDVNRSAPVVVQVGGEPLSDVIEVSTGKEYTCALLRAGTVRCWGSNSDGQLGDGTGVDAATPVEVVGLSGATQVSSGDFHTCALLTGGAARCWGANWDAQLGDGSYEDRVGPVAVVGLAGVVGVSSGGFHTCASLSDGTVYCWGANWEAQLGDGTYEDRVGPVAVVGLAGVVGVSSGGFHTCALLSGGAVRCWGANWALGQLGDGTDQDRSSPVAVLASGSVGGDPGPVELTGVAAVSSGTYHTCAASTDGTVRCWGANWYGQLGIGLDVDDRLNPVQVEASGWRGSDPATQALLDVAQVSSAIYHTCALLTDGTVRCWGKNVAGQLGDGTRTLRLNPVQVLTGDALQGSDVLSGVVSVSAGGRHTCAVLADGTVRCWGSNVGGSLGVGTTAIAGSATAVAVLASGTPDDDPAAPMLTDVTQISAGNAHTCALLTSGEVRCWGANRYGQLGVGLTFQQFDSPTSVLASGSLGGIDPSDPAVPLSGVVQVSAGDSHTCALLSSGEVRCWGRNASGELGDGTTGMRVNPVPVGGSAALSDVEAIAAGGSHTCALVSGGTVRCWGANDSGALGDGTTTSSLNPTAVLASGAPGSDPASPELAGVTRITSGGQHTCALIGGAGDAEVRCWGANASGQLGAGTLVAALNPAGVLAAGSTPGSQNLTGVAQVSAGDVHTCASMLDGSSRCWGDNGRGSAQGRLGIGVDVFVRSNPVDVLLAGFAGSEPAPTAFLLGTLEQQRANGVTSEPTSLALTCSPGPQAGRAVTCTVTGGEPGIEILWRAAYNPTFAGEGVTLDAAGEGSFAFIVPAAALGQPVTVELVGWLAPASLGVVGGAVPTTVPAGGGPAPAGFAGSLVLLVSAVGLVLRLGSRPGRSA